MDTKATKFHPILFSTPMVQAILEGRKTQTRRMLKPTPIENKSYHFEKLEKHGSKAYGMVPNKGVEIDNISTFPFNGIWFCPYEVGDVLWVRETWQIRDSRRPTEFFFKATNDMTCAPWKPSIHMPKQACRIFLKIKSIRVERLQDISEEDAIAEGAAQYEEETDWLTAKYGFQMIWETINGKDSWNKNPFVWVYEFEQIEEPLNFIL